MVLRVVELCGDARDVPDYGAGYRDIVGRGWIDSECMREVWGREGRESEWLSWTTQ